MLPGKRLPDNVPQKRKDMKHKRTRTIIEIGVLHALQQMKNPLTNIMLSVELIGTETDEEKKQTYYKMIQQSASKMEMAIKGIYNFFKDLNTDAAAERESLSKKKWDLPPTDTE